MVAAQVDDVAAYLANKGVTTHPAAGDEITARCFFCPDGGGSSRKGKLYINTAEQLFHCKRCEASGNVVALMRHFGDTPKDGAEGDGANPAARRRILEEAAALGAQILANDEQAMLYLINQRGLSPETIVERQLGLVKPPWSLTEGINARREDLAAAGLLVSSGPRQGQDFFTNHLLIPYTYRGSTVLLRGKALDPGSGGRYMTGPRQANRLFNADALDDAEDAIVTEGEFDAMVLYQELSLAPDDAARRIGVVGLAGVNALPESIQSYFRDARRVFIGFDPDDPGRRGAVRLKEQLGTKARIIELPAQLPKCDWTEYLTSGGVHGGHTWRDVLELMSGATGKRLFTVSESARKWRARAGAGTGIKTGFHGLDATIHPGLLPGQLMVLLAKTGTGKTIWLCNLAYNTRSVPTLFVSLEQTVEEVYERLRRIYLFHHPRARDDEIDRGYEHLLICDENRLGPEELSQLIAEYEVEHGQRPQQVFIDYLGYYARGMRGVSPYDKVSNAAMQLKAEAKAQRVGLVAPHQVNRLAKGGKPIEADEARDSGVVEETADFLLSIFRPDVAAERISGEQQPTGKLRLGVNKSRHGGSGQVFTLQMDPLTLAIVDDDSPAAKTAAHHTYLEWRGETYEGLRRSQIRPLQGVFDAS